MPKGEASLQTLRTERYQKKAGYMTKGFKLKRDIVEQFEKACIENGESQAAVITRLMNEYIKNNK